MSDSMSALGGVSYMARHIIVTDDDGERIAWARAFYAKRWGLMIGYWYWRPIFRIWRRRWERTEQATIEVIPL